MTERTDNRPGGRRKRAFTAAENPLDDLILEELQDPPARAGRERTEEEAARMEAAELKRLEEIARHERGLLDQAHSWSHTHGERIARAVYAALAAVICLAVIAVLLTTVSNLPPFGHGENPIHNEVSARYIEQGPAETGALNFVAGMILDYRAFDTLGESHVLFIACCAVLILLRLPETGDLRERMMAEANDRVWEPKHDIILQRGAGFLVPVILLFGVYVLLNGHLGPGGGFSGGAAIGAGLILYLNAYGFAAAERFLTIRSFRIATACALGFYALSKAWSFFCGANGLESGIGPGTAGALFSAGLIPFLNVAVGLVVAFVLYAFYTLFRKGDL